MRANESKEKDDTKFFFNVFQCFDRGMKVAFEEFHLWFQFGLSLISAGKVCVSISEVHCY